MIQYLLIGGGIGAGVAILQTYLEYRREKKLLENCQEIKQLLETRGGEISEKIIQYCKSLERKVDEMSPEEARRMLGIK